MNMYCTWKINGLPFIAQFLSLLGLSSVGLALYILYHGDFDLHITHPDHLVNIHNELRKLEVGIENTLSGFLQMFAFVPFLLFFNQTFCHICQNVIGRLYSAVELLKIRTIAQS